MLHIWAEIILAAVSAHPKRYPYLTEQFGELLKDTPSIVARLSQTGIKPEAHDAKAIG